LSKNIPDKRLPKQTLIRFALEQKHPGQAAAEADAPMFYL
jgi:hypothetical protein